MNVELLLEHFDDLSDAPERISGIRRVILAYLLHASANSPDAIQRAAVMRESHAARTRERSRNINRKEPQGTSQVSHADLPPSLSDLPVDLFDRLGNVASIEKGLSQIQSTKPGPYPLVVTAEARSSSETFDFEGAAAIVPLVSSTGHGDASLKRLHYQEGRYAVGNILAVVKPICPDLVGARFIYEYLSAFKEELLVARMSGTANVSLTVNKLKEVPVPLLSGPVLSRIDELMALCDRLEAQQQERDTQHAALVRASLARFTEAPTPANLEFLFHPSYEVSPADLRKTILTLAVQGKLVPQDPNDEPAAQLLKRILAEKKRRTGRSERFDEEAGLSPNDEPFEIPENWEWIYATTPAIMVSDQGKKIQTKDILEFGKYPVVDQGKMFIRGYCDDPEKVIRIDGPIVLFGDHTRETKFIDFDFVVGADGVKLLQPICIDPRYYFWVLRSLPLESRGYARHFKLLKTSRIPLPPLAEQKRIVAKVEQLMALVDELKQQLAACRATAEKLLTALVAELTSRKGVSVET